jgi:hypothetical protein
MYEESTLTMTGGTICENSAATGGGGGGVYCDKDVNFTMSGGKICANSALQGSKEDAGRGGGVYCYCSNFTMTGGVIGDDSTNAAATSTTDCSNYVDCVISADNQAGGGIYYNSTDDTKEMKLLGGTIARNYSSNNGGGVCVKAGKATIKNTISYNRAADKGGALYAFSGSVCSLGGDAYVPCGDGSNDVYLSDKTCNLKLASPLAKHKAADAQHVALSLLTGGSNCFSHGDTVVATDPERVLSDADYKCFKLAPSHEAGGLDLTLSFDNKSIKLDKPIYVKQGGSADADGTRAKPFGSIEAACAAMTNATKDYTILVLGTLEGAQTIPNDVTANSITIMGANGLYPADHATNPGEPIDALDGKGCHEPVLYTECSCSVILGNIKITGANHGANGGAYLEKMATFTYKKEL